MLIVAILSHKKSIFTTFWR